MGLMLNQLEAARKELKAELENHLKAHTAIELEAARKELKV